MAYIGSVGFTTVNTDDSTVEARDLASEVTDKLLGTNNVTESNLSSAVLAKLLPTISAGDGGKGVDVNSSEDGYEVSTSFGSGANQILTLDENGALPAIDGSQLSGVATGDDTPQGIFLTPPSIGGAVSNTPNGAQETYTASGSAIVDPAASSFDYHWEIDKGTLSTATGASTNVSFDLAHRNSDADLSVYSQDDQGNKSATIHFTISIADTQAPSGLSLSLPAEFGASNAEQCDITVGDDGYDPNFTYSWERNVDSGGWVTTGFSNPILKNPTLTLTTGTNVQVRCTVTNTGGSATATSSSLTITYMSPDADSSYTDTDAHAFANESMVATVVDADTINVPVGLEPGTPDVFNTAATSTPSITFSGNDTVVVAYEHGGSSLGYTVVGTVSGTAISWGTPELFGSLGAATSPRVSYIDSTKVVLVFKDGGDSGYGVARVGTISGTSISWGTKSYYQTGGGSQGQEKIVTMGSGVVVICHKNPNTYGTGIVGTVSGTDISFGTAVEFNSAVTDNITLAKVDTNKVAVCFRDDGNSGYGTSCVGTVSGTSISWGTAQVFESAPVSDTSLVYTGNDKVVVCYKDYDNSYYATYSVGTVSGTSISWGTPGLIFAANYTYISVVALDDSTLVVSYRDTSVDYGASRLGALSGSSITWEDQIVFEYAQANNIDSINGNNTAILVYKDGGNSSYGTSAVLDYNAEPFFANDVIQMPDGKLDVVASVAAGGSGGQDVTLTAETSSAGTVYNMSPFYTVPQIAQQGGQDPFGEMSLEVQFDRNKIAVTEETGDVKIDHGGTASFPFRVGDNVLVAGDTEVITTVDGVVRSGTGPYYSTISTVAAIPTNVATIELLPVQLEGDLNAGTPTYAALTETYSTVNASTAKAVATLSGDSGDYADIKVKVHNTDLNEANVTRIDATFQA